MKRLRGFLGEQSFEITEGLDIPQILEQRVYSDAYRAHVEQGIHSSQARVCATEAVMSFRKLREDT